VGLWDINNAYFKYSIWASGIATSFTKMEVRGTLRVKKRAKKFAQNGSKNLVQVGTKKFVSKMKMNEKFKKFQKKSKGVFFCLCKLLTP